VGKILSSLKRHAQAFGYVITVVLPVLLRTGKRPVIFSKYSGIGDIICTFPAALVLRLRHPQATCIYNCHPDFVCLPRLAGVASRTTSLIPIGLVGYWYGFLLSNYYSFASDDDNPNVIPTDVYIKDFGRHFGIALADDHPRLQCEPAVVNRVQARLVEKGMPPGPIVAIHPGPSWPVREWPAESWAALIRGLQQQGFSRIVQLGAARHLALGEVATAGLPGVLSLVDQLTVEETTALISLAQLFVGIDSGLLHIAAAVQTPAVGLWGPTSAHLRFSRSNARSFVTSTAECQGCHHRVPRLHWITGCPHDLQCMKGITVNQVLQVCLSRLESCKDCAVATNNYKL
jgi:ADP-heptose:LPS heptosyltransferase